MAKQEGIFPIKGKMGDKSFYSTRNGGHQVRSINPTIGQRVKKSPEYLNTRKHNGEFGAATDMAAQTLQPLNQRWRYLLRPDVQGLLTAKAFEQMQRDTNNQFGQRTLLSNTFVEFQNYYNSLNKNQLPEFLSSWMYANVGLTNAGMKLVFNNGIGFTVAQQEAWHERGIDSMIGEIYGFRVSVPYYHPGRHRYIKALGELSQSPIVSHEAIFDYDEAQVLFEPNIYDTPFFVFNLSDTVSGILIVLKPCQRINGVSYVLQGMCSSIWYSVPN